MRTTHVAAVAGLVLCSFALQAQQTLFVLPGQLSTNTTVTAITVGSLVLSGLGMGSPGVFTVGAGAFTMLEDADGSKFYAVADPPLPSPQTVTKVLPSFATAFDIADLTPGAQAAIITPDNQFLLVAAGNLQIYRVFDESQPLQNGFSLSGSALDVSASIDSSVAFVVVKSTLGGFQLTAINLKTFTLQPGSPLGLNFNRVNFVATGPNGLIYVAGATGLATSQIWEIDPSSLLVRNIIPVAGDLSLARLTFTPDGKFLLAASSSSTTTSALMMIDLNAKVVAATLPVPNGAILTSILPVSGTRALAYSQGANTLFDFNLNSPSPATAGTVAAFTSANSVGAATVSSDLASGGSHPTTRYAYYVIGTSLFQFDLLNGVGAGSIGFSGVGNTPALSVAAPAFPGPPASLLTYGDGQTVPLSGTTAPLVVRAFDGQGNPVANASVVFSTQASGVTFQNANTLTNTAGQAATTVTVPGITGAITINVTVAGTLVASFTINVGTSTGGGGPGVTSALTIVGGQGSLVLESTTTSQGGVPATMIVKFADANGNPLPGVTITYTASGGGTLQCGAASAGGCVPNGTSLSTLTDSNGLAYVDFSASSVPIFPGFVPITVTASSTSSTVTFYITAVSNAAILTIPTPTISAVPLVGSAGQVIKAAITTSVSIGATSIPNVSLFFLPDSTIAQSGSCAGNFSPFAMSDNSGMLSCDVILSGTQGDATLTAEVGYDKAYPVRIHVTAGPPAKMNILTGNNQSGKPGDTLPIALLVQLTDASGNLLPNTPVSWAITPANGATLQAGYSTSTDSQAHASARVVLGNVPGLVQVTVSAGAASATFSITVNVVASGIQIVAGNNQSAALNTAFATLLVVKVTNSQGGAVPSFPVTFSITSGTGILANPNATTDASGNASTAVTAGGSAGALVITATASTFQVTFNLTVLQPGPTNLIFLNAASLLGVNAQANIVSAGELVTIQGNGIAQSVQGIVLPNGLVGSLVFTLAGVSVSFNNIPAPISSVSNVNGVQRVTVQVPYELPATGNATVTITVQGGGSANVQVTLQPFAPGVFQNTVGGVPNQAIAERPDGSFVSAANPARRGEVIIIFVTGVGQTTPPTATNQAGVPGQSVAAQVAAGLNNLGYTIISAQAVEGLVGVFAIAFQIPADASPGAQIPVGFIVYDSAGNAYFAPTTFIVLQ